MTARSMQAEAERYHLSYTGKMPVPYEYDGKTYINMDVMFAMPAVPDNIKPDFPRRPDHPEWDFTPAEADEFERIWDRRPLTDPRKVGLTLIDEPEDEDYIDEFEYDEVIYDAEYEELWTFDSQISIYYDEETDDFKCRKPDGTCFSLVEDTEDEQETEPEVVVDEINEDEERETQPEERKAGFVPLKHAIDIDVSPYGEPEQLGAIEMCDVLGIDPDDEIGAEFADAGTYKLIKAAQKEKFDSQFANEFQRKLYYKHRREQAAKRRGQCLVRAR